VIKTTSERKMRLKQTTRSRLKSSELRQTRKRRRKARRKKEAKK